MKLYRNITYLLLLAGLMAVFSSCYKTDYYKDSGIHDPHFNGNMMEYLESRPDQFALLTQAIKLAGMEDVFKGNEITFFAPADSSIIASIDWLNEVLYMEGLNPVTRLDQIPPQVWRDELSLYIFPGKHLLDDYPQLDLNQIPVFPGQAYVSYGGRTMNIGVVYNDAGGVQFTGYRQLIISYIPSFSAPQSDWISTSVASVNIQPDNGVVHALRYSAHFFGFSLNDFVQNAIEQGVGRN